MNILVFSDSHLAAHFDEKKYLFLEKIIKHSDSVIINGDFWDGYFISFKAFISSPWRKLFAILKSKRTVYIFGNHDRPQFSDKRLSLFSDIQTSQYRLKWNNKTLIFEHGNRLAPLIDEYISCKTINKLLTLITMQALYRKTSNYLELEQRGNNRIHKNIKKELENNETIYICGHTHLAQHTIADNLIISGPILEGKACYLKITETEIIMKKESY